MSGHPARVSKHSWRVEAAHRAAQQVTEAVAHVPGLASLTPHERKKLVKMRPGAERYIRALAEAAARDPRACPTGVDPAATRAQIETADELAELHAALVAALRTVEDTMLYKQSRAYGDALDIYAVVQSQARRDPALHAIVAPFESFLATGPHHHAANTTAGAPAR